MYSKIGIVMLSSILAASALAAQDVGHEAYHHAAAVQAAETPHTVAYRAAMQTMHTDMAAAMTDSDPDMAFARGMIPHHQGAIEMAKIQLQYGKDPAMLRLAQNVIRGQEPEIRQMQQWLSVRAQTAIQTKSQVTVSHAEHSSDWQRAMMEGITDPDPDAAFARGMIPHHQGAIEMAQRERQQGKDPAMLHLAEAVLAAQQPEIDWMRQWLDNRR